MKLIGKRIERLNQFGDNLVIKIADEGNMRLSPALMSRLKIDKDNNKIGFGYPENEGESLVIYNAIDGDGVAVNKQGYIKNLPHNRDLRSYLNLPGTGDSEIYVTEGAITFEEYPGMTFYKVTNIAETVEETTENWEEEVEDVPTVHIKEHPPGEKSNETKAEETIADLHQAVEKSGGEIVGIPNGDTMSDTDDDDAFEVAKNIIDNETNKSEEDSLDIF